MFGGYKKFAANSLLCVAARERRGARVNRCPLFRPQMPLESISSPSADV